MKCHYCGCELVRRWTGRMPTNAYTRDHMIPRSRGGKGLRGNTVPCCRRCNQRKGNMTASEFIRRFFAYPRAGLPALGKRSVLEETYDDYAFRSSPAVVPFLRTY